MFPLLATLVLAGAEPGKPTEKLLWRRGVPGSVGKDYSDRPTFTIYLPAKEKAVGTGVVVCPGGGYGALAMGHEGREIAAWLNARGIAAFVLKYRLGPRYRHPAPLLDAQRAIRIARARAKEFGIQPDRVGIWGFSAGGHLASTAATLFDNGKPGAADPIDAVSSRPDFAILAYPVITLEPPHTHAGSRNNLLGDKPDPALVKSLSTHTRVTPRTPPVFLFHTREDRVVPVQNSELFAAACRANKVPVEVFILEKGRHGVGLGGSDAVLAQWPKRLEGWLRGRGLLSPPRSPR